MFQIIAYLKSNGALTGFAVENLAAITVQKFMRLSIIRIRVRRKREEEKLVATSSLH